MGRLRFILALALLGGAPLLAQGRLDDLVGVYPLKVTGGSCRLLDYSMDVRSVGESGITLKFPNGERVVPFDPARRIAVIKEEHYTTTITFQRLPKSVRAVMDTTYGGAWSCKGRLEGEKEAPALTELAASGSASEPSGEAAGPPAGAEQGDTSDVEQLALLLGLVLLLASLGGALYVRARRRPATGGVGGLAGKAGLLAGGVLSPSVGSDRFGGSEDSLEYGESAGAASIANPHAHEALTVAQAPQAQTPDALGEPAPPSGEPLDDDEPRKPPPEEAR